MTSHSLSGVATSRRTARLIGIGVIVLSIVLAVAMVELRGGADDSASHVEVTLRTDRVGDGISSGTKVLLHGVRVGEVHNIELADDGRVQLLDLVLDAPQLDGLTTDLTVHYAPSNLFGISQIVLIAGVAGEPLTTGQTIDLTAPGRLVDATMGTLLRELADVTSTSLTPRLTETVQQIGTDVRAFTPLFEAMVSTSRAIADTQKYPAAYLISAYGHFLSGSASLASGFLSLTDKVWHIDMLRNDRERFNIGVSLVADQFFPQISQVLGTSQRYLTGYADGATLVLSQVAHMVPTPALSHAQLGELLDRLGRNKGPGAALDLDVTLADVPAVAVPLLGINAGRGARR